jgi:spermidine synthase
VAARADVVERGDLCFTCSPDRRRAAPRPFVVTARTVLLVEPADPAVLILGYGLGLMGAIVAGLRPQARIFGVEHSKRLAHRARAHLPPGTELLCDDALAFLHRSRRRFDLIVDDCFVLRGDDAVRPAELHRHAALVKRRLRDGGLYVRNVLPQGRLTVADQTSDVKRHFPWLRLRRFRDWDNVLALAAGRPLPDGLLRRLEPR